LQKNIEIYRTSGKAEIGGDFQEYTFSDDQSGPTIIRFENIRESGLSTEFGLVVIPEFGHYVLVVLVASMTTMLVFGKNLPIFRKL